MLNIFFIQRLLLLLCALILHGASLPDDIDLAKRYEAETPDGFVLAKNDSEVIIAKWLNELDGMIGQPTDFPVQQDPHDSVYQCANITGYERTTPKAPLLLDSPLDAPSEISSLPDNPVNSNDDQSTAFTTRHTCAPAMQAELCVTEEFSGVTVENAK